MLISKQLLIRLILFCVSLSVFSFTTKATTVQEPQTPSGISLSPARIELEMQPGSETTVVVSIDYHSTAKNSQPVRIVANLNDWTIDRNGQVLFQKANTLPNSASSWVIYSPAETTVTPGQVHSIRVTISVPKDATPGDHLTSLIIEQRPDTIKLNQDVRQMVVRYRMAAVFYIKVPRLTRRGSLDGLQAEATTAGVVVTPNLSNKGNSVIRPITSLKVMDHSGTSIAELAPKESLPLLGGSELMQPITLEKTLAPGSYTVKYRVDFQDGNAPTEGVTDLIVRETATASRSNEKP